MLKVKKKKTTTFIYPMVGIKKSKRARLRKHNEDDSQVLTRLLFQYNRLKTRKSGCLDTYVYHQAPGAYRSTQVNKIIFLWRVARLSLISVMSFNVFICVIFFLSVMCPLRHKVVQSNLYASSSLVPRAEEWLAGYYLRRSTTSHHSFCSSPSCQLDAIADCCRPGLCHTAPC